MNKPKAIIFGMGARGIKVLSDAQQQYDVICFTDNNPSLTSSGGGDNTYLLSRRITEPRV